MISQVWLNLRDTYIKWNRARKKKMTIWYMGKSQGSSVKAQRKVSSFLTLMSFNSVENVGFNAIQNGIKIYFHLLGCWIWFLQSTLTWFCPPLSEYLLLEVKMWIDLSFALAYKLTVWNMNVFVRTSACVFVILAFM